MIHITHRKLQVLPLTLMPLVIWLVYAMDLHNGRDERKFEDFANVRTKVTHKYNSIITDIKLEKAESSETKNHAFYQINVKAWREANAKSLKLLPERNFARNRIFKPRPQKSVLSKPKMDFNRNKRLNLTTSFLIEPSERSITKCHLFILVASKPDHIAERRAIRNSWGTSINYPNHMGLTSWKSVFVFGRSHKNLQSRISEEAEEYQDILQPDVADDIFQDTATFVSAVTWLARNLLGYEPEFVLKLPDFTYINLHVFVQWLHVEFPTPRYVYAGKVLRNDKPIRDSKDPYYVPNRVYDKEYFPNIVLGPIYLFSYDVIFQMAWVTSRFPMMALEDAYIAILGEYLGVDPVNDNHFNQISKTSNMCLNVNLFFIDHVKPSEHLWLFHQSLYAYENKLCQIIHHDDF